MSDLVTDSHSIWARWRNLFSQLLNVQGLMMLGRQIYTAQSLVAKLSDFEVDMIFVNCNWVDTQWQ